MVRCSCENIQNFLNSLMDEILYFVHTRNYKQETIYYIQEIKTIFGKLFALIYNGFSHFYGKKQIRRSSNDSRANNK